MAISTHQKKRTPHASLKKQLQSEYFKLTSIKFLNELSIEEGTLLFFYCVENSFSLGAALLSKNDPQIVLWKKNEPIWRTCEQIKPTEVTKYQDILTFHFKRTNRIFSVDFSLDDLLGRRTKSYPSVFERTIKNPILKPIPEHAWESAYVFNPAVLDLDDKVHFIYRAIGDSGISVFGYASSQDGIHINERLSEPVFISPTPLTHKQDAINASRYGSGGSWCGCEDPRLVKIGDTIYMTYTAFDGCNMPGVALTSISVNDFLNKHWNWTNPILFSPLGEIHKNWVIFPEMLNGKYAILHSITPDILIDYFDDLNFAEAPHIKSHYNSYGRDMYWDNWVRGVGPPPIKTKEGWLVLYHAMDKRDPNRYKIGAMILDEHDPTKVLYRSSSPLLAPDEHYENEGFKVGVVYSCGAIDKDNKLFVYYGGADSVVCAAYANLDDVLDQVKKSKSSSLSNHTI